MDDDYELVSKQYIKQLRDENEKLKNELSNFRASNNKKDVVSDSAMIDKIISALELESKKERELIITNLNDIKDLNKSTLDNLLTKTQKLDDRLESMISTISGLVESLSHLIEDLKVGSSNSSSVDAELKEMIAKLYDMKVSDSKNVSPDAQILKKLGDIELFMKNLRILLGYIKPSDMSMSKR